MKAWIPITIIAAALLLGGCSGSSVSSWQRDLTDYVDNEGGGDPAVLRHLSDDHGRITFHSFGPQEGFITKYRTDMDGLLIGSETVGGETWYIFLVATVRYRGGTYDTSWDYPNILMIRAAALHAGPDGYTWRTGPDDEAATAAYRRPQLELPNAGHPDDPDAPVTRFPHERDRFTLSRAGTIVTIVDEHSGASWTIDLAQPES